MSESINILDKDYLQWVEELCKRYRKSQIRAAVKVNTEMLRFYWELGQDIETKEASNKYGSGFYAALSRDLRHKLPDADGLSETSVRYAKRFYCLYSPLEKVFHKLWKIREYKSSTTCGRFAHYPILYTLGTSSLYH